MKQVFTLSIHLILIFVLNIQTSQGQVEWKYLKFNDNVDNDESFLALVSAEELSNGKTVCGGINVKDENYLYPFLTILDEDGRLILDSTFNKVDQGVFFVQETSDSTFITLSNSIEHIKVVKTTYDLDLKKVSEELVLSNSNVFAFIFSYKTSLLSNGNTILTSEVSGGFAGLLYIIIDTNGNIVKKGIINTNGYHSSIIEDNVNNTFYAIGESVIELDSNFQIGTTLIEDLVEDDSNYGFGTVKFNDHYVVTNIDSDQGPILQVFDTGFNLVKTISKTDTIGDYYYSGVIFNPYPSDKPRYC